MLHKHRFAVDERGNLASVFALSLGVLVVALGGAIDTAGVVKLRGELQDTVDAATLMGARQESMPKGQIKQLIKNQVKDNPDFSDADVKVEIKDDVITVSVKDAYNTMLLGVIGKSEIEILSNAAAPLNQKPVIDLALVVDTTDSMAGANLLALRNASQSLLDTLEASGSEVRVSFVPYGNYVNVGAAAGRDWLDSTRAPEIIDPPLKEYYPSVCTVTGYTDVPRYVDGIYSHTDSVPQKDCVEDTTQPLISNDPPPYTRSYDFEGCVGSRGGTDNLNPVADASNPIPAALEAIHDGTRQNWVECGNEIIPLTDNFSTIRSALNGLTTSGRTHLPSGLLWGWRTLHPAEPYTEAASTEGDDPIRALLFMTDGGNVSRRDGTYHKDGGDGGQEGSDTALELCSQMKSQGISVYTVGYDLPPDNNFASDPAGLLQTCASLPSFAFTADNATELQDAFEDIANHLKVVRLTR